ncbi:phage minor tail protein L [Sodalis glossinidius]|uniref:phage minor tail protein L n=1 Tax=Sodalis glossinidius TaxID=63612 RepID=UPI0003118B21|nr:phage minor tail protein L [Sodalis glossinidius]
MDYANPSKPDTHEINRVETDLLLAMSALTQRSFSKLAGWNESNVSRYKERVQLFYVNAKVSETPEQMDFELCTPFDIQNLQLPTRQISPVCIWAMRGWYRSGNGCDYQGIKYFTKAGVPTNDPSKDVCGGRLADCKSRFGPDQPLSFGGQPSANLQGR